MGSAISSPAFGTVLSPNPVATERDESMTYQFSIAPGGQLSFFCTMTHFGTSEDVTVRDLHLEGLIPAGDATRDAPYAMAD